MFSINTLCFPLPEMRSAFKFTFNLRDRRFSIGNIVTQAAAQVNKDFERFVQ